MDKYVVYITYGLLVDADTALDIDSSDKDYDELRTRAVSKMWIEHGYEEVRRNAEIEAENVTKEFNNA